MASGIKTMQIDMNSLMNDVNNVIQTHIHKAVLNFNVTGIQQEIDEYTNKIQGLENELQCLSKSVSDKWTRIQHTTHKVNVSLLEEEIVSHREKIENMQKELIHIQSSSSSVEDISVTPTNNIILNIQEIHNQKENDYSSVEELDTYDEELVKKGNEVMDTIHVTKLPEDISDEISLTDEINEIIPDEEEDEEEGVFEIDLNGVSYFTTDEQNGSLYSIDVNGDPDVYVGRLENGKAIFK
jgi:hypothetical protein